MSEPQFHPIFSSKKHENKPKLKVIADNREKNSLVIAELAAQNIEVELKQLEIADYLIGEVAIERKTISDLVSSIFNKRIFAQLQNLKQYKKPLLIIESQEKNEHHPAINQNIIRGFILSTTLEQKIPIIFTNSPKDTALHIALVANKKPKESSLRPKIPLTDNEQLQFILEGFPNIGPTTAKSLLEKYKTLKSIINAPEEEIKSILGKKAEKFILLKNLEYLTKKVVNQK